MSVPLTSAAGQLATPHGQGGVEACQLWLPLQVVPHMAVKAGDASREQVQYRHLAKVWPLRQRAAQPEDCVEAEKVWTQLFGCTYGSFHSEVRCIKSEVK